MLASTRDARIGDTRKVLKDRFCSKLFIIHAHRSMGSSARASWPQKITRTTHNQDCVVSDRICSMFGAIALALLVSEKGFHSRINVYMQLLWRAMKPIRDNQAFTVTSHSRRCSVAHVVVASRVRASGESRACHPAHLDAPYGCSSRLFVLSSSNRRNSFAEP